MNEPPVMFPDKREYLLEKPLPSSEDSERTILGAILLDNTTMAEVAAKLKPEDFYSQLNRRIFAAMLVLFENDTQIDPILINEELKKEISIHGLGGITEIANLSYGLPHFSSVQEYIKIVKDKSKARQGIRQANKLTTDLLAEDADAVDILNAYSDALGNLTEDSDDVDFIILADVIDQQIEHAMMIQESGNPITGVPSGFMDLDVQLGGFQDEDLIILAGRPSMGKTALGLGIANNAAFRSEKFIAVFSIEMGYKQLVNRAICSEAGVDGLRFRSGLISHDEWDRIHEAKELLKTGVLALDDSPTLNPNLVKHKLRRLAKQRGGVMPDLVIIDYLQMMNASPGSRFGNRQEEMTQISRELKAIAKQWCPIIALSQLSRATETRNINNHRPLLGDLRESGAIEQDADVVLFVYRESMYPKADGITVGEGGAEVIIGKQRNGPTGTVKLQYDRQSTRFNNYVAEF